MAWCVVTQRYRCKIWGYNFTDTPPRPYPLEQKVRAVMLYLTARFESQGGDRRFRFGWAKRCTMRRMVASVTIASETSGSSS